MKLICKTRSVRRTVWRLWMPPLRLKRSTAIFPQRCTWTTIHNIVKIYLCTRYLQKQWTYTIWFLTIDHLPHSGDKGLALSVPRESFIITSSQSLDFLKPLCPWFLTDGCNCFCPFLGVSRVDHKWLTHWKFTQCFSISGVSTNQNGKKCQSGVSFLRLHPAFPWMHQRKSEYRNCPSVQLWI